ncbi:MAG: hypothetical protein H6767_03035 [Candidatus Peribacteria bacterium]|nr:MAG: hypothetical protein H6767_03035 [Candidatus Peribacteria bacterium]
MKIQYHKRFLKSYRKKDMFVRKKFQETLVLFISNPLQACLHNHNLKGKYIGYRSINVTGDIRALFREV